MSKTKAQCEFEVRANAAVFDLAEQQRQAWVRADGRLQEVGKDAQYWIEIGASDAFGKAVDILNKSINANLFID